jgi:hypothetical protein
MQATARSECSGSDHPNLRLLALAGRADTAGRREDHHPNLRLLALAGRADTAGRLLNSEGRAAPSPEAT